MPSNTMEEGLRNKCCNDERNMEYRNGDGVCWEEYICIECGLEYNVGIEILRCWKDAEMLERSIKTSESWAVDLIVDNQVIEIFNNKYCYQIFEDYRLGYMFDIRDNETMELLDSNSYIEIKDLEYQLKYQGIPNKHIKKAIKLMEGLK
jgi:hypothetical protein